MGCPGSADRARGHGGDGGGRRGPGGEPGAGAARTDARRRAAAGTEAAAAVDGESLPRRQGGVEESAAGERRPGPVPYSTMRRQQESPDEVAWLDARQVPCLGRRAVISASTGHQSRSWPNTGTGQLDDDVTRIRGGGHGKEDPGRERRRGPPRLGLV